MTVLIMVVDDDADLRGVVIEVLTDAGYSVLSASSGQRALDMLALEPDLIVLDLQLPDIHGAMVWRHIHAQSPTTPVIVISGSTPVGIDPAIYLSKPFSGDQLLAAVQTALGVKQP